MQLVGSNVYYTSHLLIHPRITWWKWGVGSQVDCDAIYLTSTIRNSRDKRCLIAHTVFEEKTPKTNVCMQGMIWYCHDAWRARLDRAHVLYTLAECINLVPCRHTFLMITIHWRHYRNTPFEHVDTTHYHIINHIDTTSMFTSSH